MSGHNAFDREGPQTATGECFGCPERDKAAEDVAGLTEDRRKLRDLNRELVEALDYAADWIAACQRQGCEAGVVAVPSRVNDALAKAKEMQP